MDEATLVAKAEAFEEELNERTARLSNLVQDLFTWISLARFAIDCDRAKQKLVLGQGAGFVAENVVDLG